MLKNYLKIAIAVLLRRKFLTFVNLFGTVLVLTVLVVAFAIFESIVHPAGAQHRYDRILAVQTVTLGKLGERINSGGVGPAFFENYVKPLRTADRVSLVSTPRTIVAYVEGRKLKMALRVTDAAYWQILDFDVRAGRVLSADDVASGKPVAVINEATAEAWFPGKSAVGRSIVVTNRSYEVVGVVRNEPETSRFSFGDVWLPVTATEPAPDPQEWIAMNQALLYVGDSRKRDAMRAELEARVRRFEVNPDPNGFRTLTAVATTPFEDLATRMLANDFEPRDYVGEFIAAVIVVTLLFMVLPAVNLINLNVGRIMERAPEIGLRKATGAPTRTLVGQFIFENLVLALVGGLISLALAPFALGLVNTVLRYGQLRLDMPVLGAGLAFVAVFGVLSGAWPAWKMARLDPAAALRGQQ
jgi:putative ABC transport system permease protein